QGVGPRIGFRNSCAWRCRARSPMGWREGTHVPVARFSRRTVRNSSTRRSASQPLDRQRQNSACACREGRRRQPRASQRHGIRIELRLIVKRVTTTPISGAAVAAVSLCVTLLCAALPVHAQGGTRSWAADNGNGTYSNPLFYDEFSDPDMIRV